MTGQQVRVTSSCHRVNSQLVSRLTKSQNTTTTRGRFNPLIVIFHVLVEKPPVKRLLSKLSLSREMADIITRANFGVYKLRG